MSIVELIRVPKFSDRARLAEHFATVRRRDTLEQLQYECLSRPEAVERRAGRIFTLATIVFDGDLGYIESSLGSMSRQTYPEVEFILVDNGTTGAARALVDEFVERNDRTKIVRLAHNFFAPGLPDESNPWPILVNAALFLSTGDYFFPLSYDDFLSENYVARMVDLFSGNPACTTAAPGVASVGPRGEANASLTETFANLNDRPRYVRGIELARGHMRNQPLLVAPGEVLAFSSGTAVGLGGIDWMNDVSQILRIAVTGESGFDGEATLYWRHHPEQTNKVLTKQGQIYYSDFANIDANYGLTALYSEVGTGEDVQLLHTYIEDLAVNKGTIGCIRLSCLEYGFQSGARALRNAFEECPKHLWMRCTLAFVRWAPEGALKKFARKAAAWRRRIRARLAT